MTDLGFDLKTKSRLVKRVRDGYAKELGVYKKLRDQLSEKFRTERQRLTSLFQADRFAEATVTSRMKADATVKACLNVIHGRSKALRGISKKLRQYEKAGTLSVPLEDLAVSYIHMHVHRLLESGHREQEFVISDFLARLYDSRIAQGKVH